MGIIANPDALLREFNGHVNYENLEGRLRKKIEEGGGGGLSKAEAEALVKVEKERAETAEALKASKEELATTLKSWNRLTYQPQWLKASLFPEKPEGILYFIAGEALGSSIGVSQNPPYFLVPVHTGLDISGYTTKLRLRCVSQVGAVAPEITFNIMLYSLKFSGANLIANAEVSGSKVEVTTTEANVLKTFTGSEFTAPSEGNYAMIFTASAKPGVNSTVHCYVEMKHV